MTIFRVFAAFAAPALIALGPGALAQEGAPSPAAIARTFSRVDEVRHGRCPRLCVEWFDGCNTCTCGKGRIDVCTHYVCYRHRRARCLRYGF